jgi:hypothetical protein
MLVTPNPEGLTRCKDLLKNKNIFFWKNIKTSYGALQAKWGKTTSKRGGCACFKERLWVWRGFEMCPPFGEAIFLS